jgi:hypothetical protein
MNGKRKMRMEQIVESREKQLTKDDERQKIETKGKKRKSRELKRNKPNNPRNARNPAHTREP